MKSSILVAYWEGTLLRLGGCLSGGDWVWPLFCSSLMNLFISNYGKGKYPNQYNSNSIKIKNNIRKVHIFFVYHNIQSIYFNFLLSRSISVLPLFFMKNIHTLSSSVKWSYNIYHNEQQGIKDIRTSSFPLVPQIKIHLPPRLSNPLTT